MSIRQIARYFFAVVWLSLVLLNVTPASADNPTCTSGATPCFQLLGTLPNPGLAHGTPITFPHAISADGKVVVGEALNSDDLYEPFRWVNGTMTGLGKIPDAYHGICLTYSCGYANGVNSDGSVVGGDGYTSAGRPWVWSGGTMTPFSMGALCDPQDGSDSAGATAMSANGTIVVGSYLCHQVGMIHPFRAVNGAIADLGLLGTKHTGASAVSADGSVVVGTAFNPYEAFRWAGGSLTSLGFLPGDTESTATAISGNGAVIFGTSGARPVRWVNGVIEAIGPLNRNPQTSSNTDGTVGFADSTRWSTTGGFHDVVTLFRGWGFSFPADQGLSVNAISPDGITITGTVLGDDTNPGFIARLPLEPGAPSASAPSGIGGSFFTAKWLASPTATGYRIDVATDSSFAALVSGYSDADVGNVLSTEVTGLQPDTTYYYRVRAYNPTGPGGNSNSITAKTLQATTVAVNGSPNPSVFGQSVTFTAAVTSGAGTPTGTVTFNDGANTLGSGTLSGGTATLAISTLTVGNHTITAAYNGDASFSASISPNLVQAVNNGATTTAVAGAPNPSVFGQSVTFTATIAVTSPASGTPTGMVTFNDGASTLGTGTLSGGTATLAISTLTVGNHTITASYGGDASFVASVSSGVTQTVNGSYTITVSASPPAGGTVGGGGTFAGGSSRTVTATPNSGYSFVNWTEGGNQVSTSASYNFTLTVNRTLVANFSSPAQVYDGIIVPTNRAECPSDTPIFWPATYRPYVSDAASGAGQPSQLVVFHNHGRDGIGLRLASATTNNQFNGNVDKQAGFYVVNTDVQDKTQSNTGNQPPGVNGRTIHMVQVPNNVTALDVPANRWIKITGTVVMTSDGTSPGLFCAKSIVGVFVRRPH